MPPTCRSLPHTFLHLSVRPGELPLSNRLHTLAPVAVRILTGATGGLTGGNRGTGAPPGAPGN